MAILFSEGFDHIGLPDLQKRWCVNGLNDGRRTKFKPLKDAPYVMYFRHPFTVRHGFNLGAGPRFFTQVRRIPLT